MTASDPLPSVPPEDPRKCPTCGTKLIPASQAFSEIRERITAEEPPAISEMLDDWLTQALDDLQARAMDVASMESPKSMEMLKHRDAVANRMRAARAALVALFDRQREALEMFRDEQSRDKAEVSSLSSQLECAIKERKFAASSALLLDDQFKQVCAELESERSQLERLKAEQLTAEEARVLTKWCDYYSLATEPMFGKTYPAIEKLRRLSQSEEVKE